MYVTVHVYTRWSGLGFPRASEVPSTGFPGRRCTQADCQRDDAAVGSGRTRMDEPAPTGPARIETDPDPTVRAPSRPNGTGSRRPQIGLRPPRFPRTPSSPVTTRCPALTFGSTAPGFIPGTAHGSRKAFPGLGCIEFLLGCVW